MIEQLLRDRAGMTARIQAGGRGVIPRGLGRSYGAAVSALERLRDAVEVEIAAAADNPLVVPGEDAMLLNFVRVLTSPSEAEPEPDAQPKA